MTRMTALFNFYRFKSMIEDYYSLNDTLDNFTFQNLQSQSKIKNGTTSKEICFDDSFFFENCSIDIEKIQEKIFSGGDTNSLCNNIGVLKENTKNISHKNSANDQESLEENKGTNNLDFNNIDIEKYNASSSFNENVKKYNSPKFKKEDTYICKENRKNQSKEFHDNVQCKQMLKTPPLTLSGVSSLSEPFCTKNVDNICKSTNSLNCNFELAAWGLPDTVIEKYTSRKIKTMFPWQFECLSNSKVLNGLSNLIYSAPTSAGKTLVAEILALKTIFERKKKVIFILPFVSIVREKMYYFQDILGSSGIRVDGFMGSYNPPGGFNSINFAICTIEKANNLINRLLEEGRLSEIGSILVDEMHLLGDPHRGYILELLLTKLRYISLRDNAVQIQIIGMSATLPNLDELANWLGAELFSTSFRPIPLYEQASVCGEIYDRNLQLIRRLEPLPNIGVDTDNVLQLCLETIKDSCSVLIFCPTKNWCENLAQQLSLAFFEIGNSETPLGQILRSQIKSDLIMEVLQQLKYCPVGLDQVLKKTISFGIAFHHAGLTIDERDIIEGAFRNGAIKILIATSTLSSGVNLPARRVLIRSPSFCGKPLNILTYRQMIGRAGRMGKDTKGESILICQKSDYKIAKELMSGELPRVESCLEEPGKLKRAILEVIASGVASSPDDITSFTNCTLLAVSNSVTENFQDPISEAVEFLKKYEFIRLQLCGDGEKYVATSLGKACLSSSVAPDEGLTLFTELEKARQCFVLDTELHLIYLVTPYSSCHSWGNIDWMFYLDLWDKLSAAMKRVGELVGVRESYLVSATRGKIDNSSKAIHKLMIHKRFFVALALQDLVNEIPLANVCAKFNCNRGMLQSLQQSASSFAGMVTSFSRQLGWSSVEILLAQFQDRMQFGVSRDLLDLMRLPSLNGKLARILYNAGIETMIQLANYNLDSVENILCRAGPFESCKEREGESEFDYKERNKLRTVWVTGKEGLTEREAAELLVQDARNYLEAEMGLKEAKWKSQSSNEEVTNHKSSQHSLTHNSTQIEDMVIPTQNLCVISSSSSLNDVNVMSLIELPNPSNTFIDISQEKPKTQQVDIKVKSRLLSNLPSTESFDLDISNSSSIFSDISFTRLEDNMQIHNNIIHETRVKDMAYPDIKKPDQLIKNSSLDINISESSVFSSLENLSLDNSKIKSATDDSFSLELNDDSSEKKFNLFTQSIDEFDSQGNFEAALQNINFSQEIKKMENVALEYNESQKRSRESSGATSDDSILEGTPKKKTKILDELRTPLRNTIKMYSKMNLEDAFSEITDFSKLHIVDVCSTDTLIDTFFDEIKEKMDFSFCVVCMKKLINKPTIGENIFPNEKNLKTKSPQHLSYKDKIVGGFAFCWGGTESYFLSTKDLHISEKILKILRQIFTNNQRTVKMFDAKEQIKTLKQCCDVEFCCKIDDPKVADWLLDAEGKEKSLQTLNLQSQSKIKNGTTSKEICFDDSFFFENCSIDIEKIQEKIFSGGDTNSLCNNIGVLKENTKNISHKNSANDQESLEENKGTNNLDFNNIDIEKYNASSSFNENVKKYNSPKFKKEDTYICKENRKNQSKEFHDNVQCKQMLKTPPLTLSGVSSLSEPFCTKNVDNICKSTNSLNCNFELAAWGLPDTVIEKYTSRKIKTMFPWQFECLSNSKVLNGLSNLIYSAPTSAGKTLVAEILALKTIFERKKKVIFILPFVSIVREKMYYFQDILGSSGIRVDGFMGSYNPPGGFNSINFAICTIEKANNLINRLLEEGRLSEIGSILVDEMHLLGDPHRGYILELLLTKLRYISLRDNAVQIQIIGMSATLPNLDELANWLGAELFSTSFRPIPLYEQASVCGEIYDRNLQLIRRLEPLPNIGVDTDNVLQLCLETIKDSCSVLIFCPTKNWCENLAQQLSLAFFEIGNSETPLGQILRSQIKSDLIMEVLQQLKYCPVGLDQVLKKTISFGIAFHHAGLTIDERDIIEGAFRNGAIKILIATSTLSSGVNLPARRVLIRSPSFCGKPLNILTYRQMIGRAGRMGKDTKGESILICQKSDYKIAKELMSGELPRVESCLEEPGKLKRAILEVIASGVASSPDDITSFTNCTLLAVSNSVTENFQDPISEAVEFLKKYEFIRLQLCGDGEKYVATSLGKACLSSSVAPDEGLTLFTELEKARQCFVLDTELHLIYLVTPYSSCHSWGNIDWMFYLDLWDKLSAAMKRVGELVGVRESYLVSATRGKIDNSSKAIHKLMIHKRFFVALALQDLVNEIPLANVCAKFNCNRGMLQSLQQSASSFAGMVTSFSRQLGWSSVEILLAQFQDRMQFGVSRDLLDLMRLPSLNGKLARILYNAGIETMIQLANYNLDSVENILCRAGPFESCKEREGESEFDYKERNKLRTVWVTGKEGLTEREAAELLVQDARNYLEAEMGLKEAKWKSQSSNEEVTNHKSSQHSLTHNSTQIEDMVIPTQNLCVISSSSSLNDVNVMSLIELPNPSNTFIDISQEKPKTQQVDIKVKSRLLSNLPSTESFDLDISNSSSIFSDISFTRLEDNMQIHNNIIHETRVKDMAYPDIKKPDQLIKNSSLDINISESSVFSSLENLSLDNSKIKSATDDSFSLELNDDSSEKKFNLFTQSIDEFDSQGNFEAALQNINFSQEIKKMENVALEYNESQKRSRESSGATSDDSILEGTPKKKTKILDELRTPLRNTIKMYSKMNLEDAFSEITDFSKLHIVDVCSTDTLIDTFFDEIKEKMDFSFCVVCMKKLINKPTIGENIFPNEKNLKTKSPQHLSYKDKIVGGFAFCWGGTESYFLSTKDLHISEKILKILRQIFTNNQRTVKMFDAKEQIKTLKQCCDVEFCCKIDDPKVADWLLDAEGKEKSLQTLVNYYNRDLRDLGLLCGEIKTINGFELNVHSEDNPKLRSSVEVVVIWHLVNALKKKLLVKMPQINKISLTSFPTNYELEMQTQLCLANMELNGMSANKMSLQQLADLLKNQQNALEKKAYSLAGRRFNFVSSTDVSKVIGICGAKKSTNKQVLEQIDHPISELVILWRKINFTLTKMIYPLIRLCENNKIHGSYITHTATGRITMHEPNIQMVTKDFAIFDPISKKNILISGRSAFSVPEEYILVSADYCQLELRILTYLSKDRLLTDIMSKPGDIFRSIAANWNNIAEDMVDENMRQNTKQLCYGIIYGMGAKTLSEQLRISEEDAFDFMESFRNTYSGIKQFIKKTVDLCKENGYVETITGRRRYLPHINSIDTSIKCQAERQAVNTTVQGSAADIVKNAMITIENKINVIFKKSRYKPKLTLHLHDELIYEVPEKYVEKTVKIIKRGMENSASIIGHFPVKIKTGKSWGQLTECLD